MSIRAVNPTGAGQTVRSAVADQRQTPQPEPPPAKDLTPAVKADRVELSSLARSSASDAPKFKLSMSELRELVNGPPEKPVAATKPAAKAEARAEANERRDEAPVARREEPTRSEAPAKAPSRPETTARTVKNDDRRSDTTSRS